MTSSRDGFSSKVVWRFKLHQHGPIHIHKSQVLPLGYTILLRGVYNGILMSNPLITKKSIQGVVLELGAIVTSYCQYILPILTFNFFGKVDDGLLSLTLVFKEIDPCIS
jgi:hypothetical protein